MHIVQQLNKRRGVCEIAEPKSSRGRRSISLFPASANLLEQHRSKIEAEQLLLGTSIKSTDFVFSNLDGKSLDPGTVSKTFSKILKEAGLQHIRVHDLRHTHARMMLKAGVHPKIVQERLGHASIAITLDTYSYVVCRSSGNSSKAV